LIFVIESSSLSPVKEHIKKTTTDASSSFVVAENPEFSIISR
jgi:hypothetical protein